MKRTYKNTKDLIEDINKGKIEKGDIVILDEVNYYVSPDLGEPIVEKGFWDYPKPNKEIGLIPKLWEDYKLRNLLTDKELKELEQIKKESFMKTMRELAKKEGIGKARKELSKS
jgi:hypothetical protein